MFSSLKKALIPVSIMAGFFPAGGLVVEAITLGNDLEGQLHDDVKECVTDAVAEATFYYSETRESERDYGRTWRPYTRFDFGPGDYGDDAKKLLAYRDQFWKE